MKRIVEDIKNKKFSLAYLLYGDEKYILKMYMNKLITALDAFDDSLNCSRFEGPQNPENIIDACETMPFFADRRTVIIEDSGMFKKKSERLAAYLKNLPAYLTLIFIEKDVDKRGKLYKSIAAYNRVIEFKSLSYDELSGFIVSELKKSGKKIRKPTLEMFLNGSGRDAGFISCELEKLVAYTGEKAEITADDIKAVCSPQIENRVFEMISDISEARYANALKNYHDLILLKESPMKMLILIQRQFRQLLEIHELSLKGYGEQEIAKTLKIHPYAVKKNLPLAKKYTVPSLRSTIEKLASYDADIKSGRINERIALELILIGA